MSKKKIGMGHNILIALVFLVAGLVSLIDSIFFNSQVLAFIGLGLVFWGALFILVSPIKYIQSSILVSTVASEYSTFERLIKQFRVNSKAFHIPPYPREVFLPTHLNGLKDLVVFISSKKDVDIPSIDDIAKERFMLKNPEGFLLTPPGLGIINLIEKNWNIDLAKKQLSEVCDSLPIFLTEQLSLAKKIEIQINENQISLKIVDSIYRNLYNNETYKMSIMLLGCPIVSAIACAIAKASGKTVTIESQKVYGDGSEVEVLYGMYDDVPPQKEG